MPLTGRNTIKGIPTRELAESLRTRFQGQSTAHAKDLAEALSEKYSEQGKQFFIDDVVNLMNHVGERPARMLELNGYVVVYDGTQLHRLFCRNDYCATCHPIEHEQERERLAAKRERERAEIARVEKAPPPQVIPGWDGVSTLTTTLIRGRVNDKAEETVQEDSVASEFVDQLNAGIDASS